VRRSLRLMILPVLALSAWSVSTLAAEVADPSAPPRLPPHHVRQTWQQRFTAANVAHDGHLTLAEARTGYGLVAKHFSDIDADHKGYVTQNDVRAWHIMRKAAHRLAKPRQNATKSHDSVQPGSMQPGSMQRVVVDPAALLVQTVAVRSDSPSPPAAGAETH
jgi:hypothetical protein